jgi:hypothetical protein
MDDTPLYKRPWFYIAGWLAFLLVVYGWQIYRMGGVEASMFDILLDLVCLFPLLLVLWMAFFAQFVLPVRRIGDRQKIFDRLITYLFGGHGPALFIENGIIKEHSGERLRRGPGVLWLDSASAAVTRTATAIKQTIGPGVHFIASHEYIAGTIDLHIQSQSLGPKENDKPFAPKNEFGSDAEYTQVQDRCKQVSALTRDGIEIIPRISVSFRVNTGFPKAAQPGSRFGYRKGVTKKDREREEQDKEAIRRAILGEGINPTESADSPRHRVAWNQLPVLLAVDVWREYVGKFTLDQLFDPSQEVPAPAPKAVFPTEEETELLSQPIRVGPRREAVQSMFASMLHVINGWMAQMLDSMENPRQDKTKTPAPAPLPTPSMPKAEKSISQKKTALQVINDMVKARLTQPEVDLLDDHGQRGEGMIPSHEYQLLQDRGLKVLSVSIGGLMFNPEIEQTIISRWSTSWLKNAKAESEQIERKKNIIESAAREQAIREYANRLSQEIVRKKPIGVKETLRTLLMRTRTLIFTNDQLRRRMTNEEQELEEIIKWIEVSDS